MDERHKIEKIVKQFKRRGLSLTKSASIKLVSVLLLLFLIIIILLLIIIILI